MHAVFLIAVFIVLVISLPLGGYLLADNFLLKDYKGKSVVQTILPPKEVSAQSPLEELKETSEKKTLEDKGLLKRISAQEATQSADNGFGPTIDINIGLEGRPAGKQATQLFMGIAPGELPANPKYVLSYLIEMPDSGEFPGISIVGLKEGTTYTAYLKSTAQIATASTLLVKGTRNQLNNGNKIMLTTGDLNEDNIINEFDLEIANLSNGTNALSPKWNENIDFNLDNNINGFDLGIIKKNLGKKGISGSWFSTPPAAGAQGGPIDDYYASPDEYPSAKNKPKGYWMWIPKF